MPTRTSYAESAWHTLQTTATTGTLTWNAGDVIVTLAAEEGFGNNTPAVPTATGLTFTSLDVNAPVSGSCAARSSFAVAGSSGSGAISCTFPGSHECGMAAWAYSNASGVGDHKEQHTTTKTLASTRQGDASAYVWLCADTAAGVVGSATPTPTNTDENTTGNYTILVADLLPVSTNQSYGQSGGGTVGPFTILVVEVLGGAAAQIGFIPHRMPLGA